MVIPLDPTLLLIPGSWLYIPVGLMWFHFHIFSWDLQKASKNIGWSGKSTMRVDHVPNGKPEVFHGFPPSFRRFSLGYLLVQPIPIEPYIYLYKNPTSSPKRVASTTRASTSSKVTGLHPKKTGKRWMSPGKRGNYDGFIHEKHLI